MPTCVGACGVRAVCKHIKQFPPKSSKRRRLERGLFGSLQSLQTFGTSCPSLQVLLFGRACHEKEALSKAVQAANVQDDGIDRCHEFKQNDVAKENDVSKENDVAGRQQISENSVEERQSSQIKCARRSQQTFAVSAAVSDCRQISEKSFEEREPIHDGCGRRSQHHLKVIPVTQRSTEAVGMLRVPRRVADCHSSVRAQLRCQVVRHLSCRPQPFARQTSAPAPQVCCRAGAGPCGLQEGRQTCPLYGSGGPAPGMHWKGGDLRGHPEAVRQAVGGGCQSGWGAVIVGYKCH